MDTAFDTYNQSIYSNIIYVFTYVHIYMLYDIGSLASEISIIHKCRQASATALAVSAGSCLAFVAPKAQAQICLWGPWYAMATSTLEMITLKSGKSGTWMDLVIRNWNLWIGIYVFTPSDEDVRMTVIFQYVRFFAKYPMSSKGCSVTFRITVETWIKGNNINFSWEFQPFHQAGNMSLQEIGDMMNIQKKMIENKHLSCFTMFHPKLFVASAQDSSISTSQLRAQGQSGSAAPAFGAVVPAAVAAVGLAVSSRSAKAGDLGCNMFDMFDPPKRSETDWWFFFTWLLLSILGSVGCCFCSYCYLVSTSLKAQCWLMAAWPVLFLRCGSLPIDARGIFLDWVETSSRMGWLLHCSNGLR